MMETTDGELINWFRDQERFWIDHIITHNNPCYKPMIMVFTRSKKTVPIMLDGGLKIETNGKDIVRMIAKKMANDGDDVIASMYYFHSFTKRSFCDDCPVKRFGKCKLKVTVLNFHLFSKFHDGILDKVRHSVIYSDGESVEEDHVEVKELKGDDIIPDGSIASAWENPHDGVRRAC